MSCAISLPFCGHEISHERTRGHKFRRNDEMIPRQSLEYGGPPHGGFVVATLTPLWRPGLVEGTFGFWIASLTQNLAI
jgi:hypothetical protein